MVCRLKYDFKCTIKANEVFTWESKELRRVQIRTRKAGKPAPWQERLVPAPYDRIIAQMILEASHGKHDASHEARRRQEYAERVLIHFGHELKAFSGPAESFRPRSLTPILQRQLWGVDDAYTPAVSDAIAEDEDDPTILDATKFYLGEDPTDPAWIPTYRRNMLYISEARWHLGVIAGSMSLGDKEGYGMVRKHTDLLMESLAGDSEDSDGDKSSDEGDEPDENVPLLSELEVLAIVVERIEWFYREELMRVVSDTVPWLHISNPLPQPDFTLAALRKRINAEEDDSDKALHRAEADELEGESAEETGGRTEPAGGEVTEADAVGPPDS